MAAAPIAKDGSWQGGHNLAAIGLTETALMDCVGGNWRMSPLAFKRTWGRRCP